MKPRDLVGERYVDALGVERVVPASTREAFIAELARSGDGGFAAITRVTRDGDPLTIDVTLPAAAWPESALWTVRSDRGEVHAGTLRLRDAPIVRYAVAGTATMDTRRLTLPLTAFVGEYRLTLDIGTYGHAGIDVVVAPTAAYAPPSPTRIWGLAVQIYTLRSPRNWGIGDFADLERVCEIAAGAGASLVGINPLHAAYRDDPESASPYSPASRHFLNWLAIDVAALPEARAPTVAEYIDSIAGDLDSLRRKPLVDYTGVTIVKGAALRLCYAALADERKRNFETFIRESGAALAGFATWEALVVRFGRDLRRWPPAFADPRGAAVVAFAAEARESIRYGMYLQWCAAEQLAALTTRAAARGVSLYRDLAVGVGASSADVWTEGHFFTGASLGAPPDLLNTRGQDWGLPPPSPTALPIDGYRAFATLLADNMRHAGALRIDHAMSIRRLFWIPAGAKPADGAYITYPFDDLLGIIARESTRAKCVVIGEDLGTVPEGFRDRMAANKILSYRLLLFERGADGAFLPPQAYPELALAATGTHDLPPLAGWLAGEDIAILERLGYADAPTVLRMRAARQVDVSQLVHALQANGDLDNVSEPTAIVLAAYRYLARTPARIVMLQIEDAIGETSPVNVPGTSTEYANWRRKLHLDLDTIAAGTDLRRFVDAMRELRPRA